MSGYNNQATITDSEKLLEQLIEKAVAKAIAPVSQLADRVTIAIAKINDTYSQIAKLQKRVNQLQEKADRQQQELQLVSECLKQLGRYAIYRHRYYFNS